ncbi:MAG: DNA polymerase III subunit beta, partial [bacterium]
KVSCTQENLNKGLNIVSHVSNKNTNLPILNNVLLQTTNKVLKLCATNLEIGVTHLARCKITEDGEIATEAKILADYINLLPKNNVEIETNENNLLISCGNHKTQINGNQTEDFPLIPTMEKEKGYKIRLVDFKEALSQTIFAASFNDLRQEISGAFFNFSNGKMTIVATDSYRLAEKIIDFKPINQDDCERSMILPLRTIQEILRILNLNEDVLNDGDNNVDVDLYVDDNQILMSSNNTELISKLVEGQYPDYKQIIPQDPKTNIIINKNELQKAVKAASLFTKAGIYDVELKVSVKNNELEIFSENSQLGRNSIKISAQVSGEDNGIVLNFRYFLDGLQNINTDQVSIDIIDMATPCLARSYKDEKVDQNYLYLIMPIRQ